VIKTQELRSQFPDCHQNLKIVITKFADCDHNPRITVTISRLGSKSQDCDPNSKIVAENVTGRKRAEKFSRHFLKACQVSIVSGGYTREEK